MLLEAMACGLPVAAYPVDGPREVLVAGHDQVAGGVLHDDLQQAWHGALATPRHEARSRALCFSWSHASQLFAGHLVPARQGERLSALPRKTEIVTPLSSNP